MGNKKGYLYPDGYYHVNKRANGDEKMFNSVVFPHLFKISLTNIRLVSSKAHIYYL